MRSRGTTLVTWLVLLGLLISACAPAAAPTPTPAPAKPAAAAPAPAKPAAPATPAPAAKPAAAPAGAEITVGVGYDPGGIDPHVQGVIQGVGMMQHVYEPLVAFNEKGELVGKLAESWEFGDKRITFKLRKGVKFHNGEDFTAEAVKVSVERIQNPDTKSNYATPMLPIARVEMPDPYTAVLITKDSTRALLRNMMFASILPPKAVKDGDVPKKTAVGTGPFKFIEYLPGQRMVMEANPAYWGGAPKLRKLTWRFIPENGTRMAAIEAGEVVMVNNVPFDQIRRLEGNANLQVLAGPSVRFVHLALLNSRPPFNDVRVRQAIHYAIDREAINNGLLGGKARIANGPLAPEVFGYKEGLKPYPYDPNKAKELLAQAGANNLKIKIGTSVGRLLLDKQVAEAIAGQLQKAGIAAEVDAKEYNTYLADARAGKYDAFLFSWGSASREADWILGTILLSKNAVSKYKNDRVDQLLTLGDTTLDEKKAASYYQEIQDIVREDPPWVPLYFQPQFDAVSKRLKGYAPRVDDMIMFHAASLE